MDKGKGMTHKHKWIRTPEYKLLAFAHHTPRGILEAKLNASQFPLL